MNLYLSNVELSTILDRIVDKAADNLRFAKILIQLGLDPDNVTYDAIFNRLLEIFLANITIANLCALVGCVFLVATLLTRTMVPLRVSNMFSNVSFMAFGALACDKRWSRFLRQPGRVDSPIRRTNHHEDAETIFG
jgi:hypothetical protein